MDLPLRIAWRFLIRSPAQSVLIIAGIAVGIGVQVFVGSLITSLQASLLETTIGSSPHLTVRAPKDGDPVTYTDAMRGIISGDPRVSAVAPTRVLSVIYTNGTDSAPLSLKGGQIGELNRIYKLAERTERGKPRLGPGEIMVGTTFAKKYGLDAGSNVLVKLPGGSQATLKVSGVFDLGSAAVNDRTAFVGSDFIGRARGLRSDRYDGVEVQLARPFGSSAVAGQWRARPAFAGTRIADWQVENKDLLQALRSQSSSSYMIQGFVLLAVAIGIGSTLAISATQKTRQIGILKAMGLTDRRAALIFVLEATILGAAGTSSGLGLGLGLIGLFQLASARSAALFPIEPQPGFIAFSCGVGMGVALLSAILPARKTSRLDPIEVVQSA